MKLQYRLLLIAGIAVVFLVLALALYPERPLPPAAPEGQQEILEASERLLDVLDEAGRAKAMMPFESEERFNFNFVPMQRQGMMLKDMTQEQRIAAHALLQNEGVGDYYHHLHGPARQVVGAVPRNHGPNTTLFAARSLDGITAAMTLEAGAVNTIARMALLHLPPHRPRVST
jgi:hypothetical protein